MKKCQECLRCIVEVDYGVFPHKELRVFVADGLVYKGEVGDRSGNSFATINVVASGKLSFHQVDPGDGEDEPEDEAHDEHIEHGGNGLDEGVHHNLNNNISNNLGDIEGVEERTDPCVFPLLHRPKRPQRPQYSQEVSDRFGAAHV